MLELKFSAQIVHHMLLCQCLIKNDDEMWFLVNSKGLRFGEDEFGLIIGLSFGISKKCPKQESLNLWNCSLLSFFLIFSITLRCDRHAAFDGKYSSIGILTLKHVERVVVYKLNKIKLVKI